MDWTRAMKEERVALMRIVALLGALAGLAERAAGRSPAMRGFVLWVLRPAEAVALDFVTGDTDAEVASMPAGPAATCPADAMRLAMSLRALAGELERQIEHQARLISAACGERGERVAGAQPPLFGPMSAMRDLATALSMLADFAGPPAHPAPDTS